jgi:hypothetical protein
MLIYLHLYFSSSYSTEGHQSQVHLLNILVVTVKMKEGTQKGQDPNLDQRGQKRKRGSIGLGQRPNIHLVTVTVTMKRVVALFRFQNSLDVPKISTQNFAFCCFRDTY